MKDRLECGRLEFQYQPIPDGKVRISVSRAGFDSSCDPTVRRNGAHGRYGHWHGRIEGVSPRGRHPKRGAGPNRARWFWGVKGMGKLPAGDAVTIFLDIPAVMMGPGTLVDINLQS